MASPLDLYSFVSGEYDAGRKQRDGNRLKALYHQALSDPSQNQRAIIGQVAAIDPSQAQGLYNLLNSRAEDQRKAVGQRAAMVRALPQEQRQAAYEGIRPDLDAAGLFAPEGADEGYLGAVAQTYGGVSAPQDSTPAAIRELQMLQANPELAALDMKRRTAGFDRPQLQIDQQGRPWFLSPGKPPVHAYGAASDSGPTGGAATVMGGAYRDGQVDPVSDFTSLVEAFPGTQVTSLARSPEKNAKVDGVANSYHLTGQGGDFVVPVAQRAAFMGQARMMGYDAIDEGDHIHLEPRRGVQASSRFSPGQGIGQGGPRFGKAPEPPKQPARQMTPQEVAAAGLAPGTVAYMGESGVPNVVQRPESGNGMPKLSAGEAAKVRRDFKETKDALNMFRAFDRALTDLPSGLGLVTDGAAKGRLGTAYNNARSSLRILYNTGVLQPGELPMLENALRDPTSPTAIMDPRTRPQIKAQLNELYRVIDRNIQNQVYSYPQVFNPQKFEQARDSAISRGGKSGADGGGKYSVGQVLNVGGKKYRVTDVSDPNDPDLEEVR